MALARWPRWGGHAWRVQGQNSQEQLGEPGLGPAFSVESTGFLGKAWAGDSLPRVKRPLGPSTSIPHSSPAAWHPKSVLSPRPSSPQPGLALVQVWPLHATAHQAEQASGSGEGLPGTSAGAAGVGLVRRSHDLAEQGTELSIQEGEQGHAETPMCLPGEAVGGPEPRLGPCWPAHPVHVGPGTLSSGLSGLPWGWGQRGET